MTIHINLDSKHFKMLESKEQKEVYINITPKNKIVYGRLYKNQLEALPNDCELCVSSGYRKDRPQFYAKLLAITIGEGRQDWGAEQGVKYYVLEIKVL